MSICSSFKPSMMPATAPRPHPYRWQSIPRIHRLPSPWRKGNGTDTLTASLYSTESSDGVSVMEITEFESVFNRQLKRELGSFLDMLYGDISATISFTAEIPALSASPLSVSIELAYSPDPDVANPVGLWNSGYLSVTAADGSALLATLDDTDGDATFESVVISVGDDQISRTLSEGYLASCRLESFEGCNP